jgi:2,3-bisphosphoglycerate-independent phosphoglycerate mutase
MTHTSDPVPFILYGGEKAPRAAVAGYDEVSARGTGVVVEQGSDLMKMMLGRK